MEHKNILYKDTKCGAASQAVNGTADEAHIQQLKLQLLASPLASYKTISHHMHAKLSQRTCCPSYKFVYIKQNTTTIDRCHMSDTTAWSGRIAINAQSGCSPYISYCGYVSSLHAPYVWMCKYPHWSQSAGCTFQYCLPRTISNAKKFKFSQVLPHLRSYSSQVFQGRPCTIALLGMNA